MLKHIGLLLCLFFFSALSTAKAIPFTRIGIQDGLSQSTVFDITQDAHGYIWVATQDGLNQYDGDQFRIFRSDAADPHSISSNVVHKLLFDKEQQLWVATNRGLSCYKPTLGHFENYYYLKNKKNLAFNTMVSLNDSTLALGTNRGIILFHTLNKTFSRPQDPILRQLSRITELYTHNNTLYIGARTGLFAWDTATHQVAQINYENLKEHRIQRLLIENSTKLWIATEGNGLYTYDLLSEQFNHHTADAKQNGLKSNFIRCMAFDQEQKLWVGTYKGLSIFDPITGQFSSYQSNPSIDNSLSQNSIRSLFLDRQAGMWVGTYFGGLNYHHPLKNQFAHFKHNPHINSLSDNVVNALAAHDGLLWIGTNEGGVNCYNQHTQTFTHYTIKPTSSKEQLSENIKAIYIDPATKKVYIGSHAGGLSIITPGSQEVKRFTYQNSYIPDVNVYSILPAGDQHLLLGTLNGLIWFDKQTHQFTLITHDIAGNPLEEQRIKTMFIDSKSRLWLGSNHGIEVLKLTPKGLEKGNVTPFFFQTAINTITELSDGVMAVGSRDGLYILDEKEKKVTHYTTKNGLPNNMVAGLVEDQYSRLWITSNHGLTCLDRRNGSFRNYTDVQGIQSNQFNAGAYCSDQGGTIYLGGINGVTSFRPDRLIETPFYPQVILTKLQLFHQEVTPLNSPELLQQTLSYTSAIHLKADQRSFSIDYTVANFLSGQHHLFRYILHGFENEWVTTDHRSISYSNIPPGEYVLEITSALENGQWSEETTKLHITIDPFWYQTWWGITLCIISIVALLVLLFRILWSRQKMRSRIEHDRIDLARIEQVNKIKEHFFVNVSQELKMPLSMIIAPLRELMSRSTDRWALSQLTYINRNANRLLYLVNQLMEYRKTETGEVQLYVTQNVIHEHLLQCFQFYDQHALKRNVEYNFYSDIQDEMLWSDPNCVNLILNSVLSIAFSDATKGDSIAIHARVKEQLLLIDVINSHRHAKTSHEHTTQELNLHLAQQLTARHHGEFTHDIQADKTTMRIAIPQDKSLYSEAELTQPAEEKASSVALAFPPDPTFMDAPADQALLQDESPSGERRGVVLLVDSSEEIRQYLTTMLSKHYQILSTTDTQKAWRMAKEQEVDMVLSDIGTDGVAGLKFCKQIKHDPDTCHLPFVFLSSKTDLQEQMKGYAAGADDYLTKPFSVSLLHAKIRNMLITGHRNAERYNKTTAITPERIATNALDEELIRKAMEVVQKNLDNADFTTDRFAREMHMSRSNLHLKLKAITGKSAIEFVHKVRFGEACRLLQENKYTITEVSAMVGFSTPSYFATSFKRYIGCLPTEYAKNNG